MKTVYLVQVHYDYETTHDYGLFAKKEEAEKQIKRIKENDDGSILDGVSITPMSIYESVEDYWRWRNDY